MKKIPEIVIEQGSEETRTNLPAFVIPHRLRPYFDAKKIEYKVYTGESIPDDWIQGWTFLGRTAVRRTAVVVSRCNSQQLIAAMEILNDIPDAEFEEYIKTLTA